MICFRVFALSCFRDSNVVCASAYSFDFCFVVLDFCFATMTTFHSIVGKKSYSFDSLAELLAKASPARSGDALAGIAAANDEEHVAAQMALADLPLVRFLEEHLIPYEIDEVTRLIADTQDRAAFEPVASMTVGEFRDWLLGYETTGEVLTALAPGLTPEMVAAVSKLMRNQDLILVASKCRVVTRFRNTIGLPGRLSIRLQPNHPTDDLLGIGASILDGLFYGCGDAVIGINPATDSVETVVRLLGMLAELIEEYRIPTQSCVLAHVTTQLAAIERGAPVDLVFQSIAGTEKANASFGISLKLLEEAQHAAHSLGRGTVGNNVMYFETGQGSCLSADAHHGVDQQTLEARAYAVARRFEPLLVNTVVGFIGPEYLYDGKQIIRAGLEDHFCGKLLGLPMGCDVCYTNHAEADQDDMDNLLTLLAVAGCNYFMGVPGADDIMLNYQSTSFHDSHYLRQLLGLRPAPEFEAWLEEMRIARGGTRLLPIEPQHRLIGVVSK
jgi:ethanolamine ammonia-lyase large subunit